LHFWICAGEKLICSGGDSNVFDAGLTRGRQSDDPFSNGFEDEVLSWRKERKILWNLAQFACEEYFGRNEPRDRQKRNSEEGLFQELAAGCTSVV
jgi:hypothetical protein